MDDGTEAMLARKQAIRAGALARRRAHPDPSTASQTILQTLRNLPEFRSARACLFYVDTRGEVSTRQLLQEALAAGKWVAVPWCAGGELQLFRLADWQELAPGKYGILEPRGELRVPERHVEVAQLDLILVPGVAFDRRGGRLGHGLGYYDRLLQRARPEAVRVGLAFACQFVDEVPMSPYDGRMDILLSEREVIRIRSLEEIDEKKTNSHESR